MKLAVFCNNLRGVEIIKFLSKKHEISIVFIAKKNLDKKILKHTKNNYKSMIVSNINTLKVFNLIKKNCIDLNIIAGFPYIFKKQMINSSKYGTINLHAGKLPQYRGGSPLNWQIINNEKKIGLSIIKITEKIDMGPLVGRTSFNINKFDNIKTVKKKSYLYFKKILNNSINNLLKKKYLKINYLNGRYFRQRNREDSKIDFKNMTNIQVHNLVRASCNPYNSFYINKRKKKIIKKTIPSKIYISGKYGKVIKKENYQYIKCKKGSVKILK